MKEFETVKTGVVAEYSGKFWGVQYEDGHSTVSDFGPIENASVCDPRYCRSPTDMTHNPANTGGYNPSFEKLSKAKLVPVTIKTVYAVGA